MDPPMMMNRSTLSIWVQSYVESGFNRCSFHLQISLKSDMMKQTTNTYFCSCVFQSSMSQFNEWNIVLKHKQRLNFS